MSPIDREDGRHWCDPASEQPGKDGTWTCPGCQTVWRLDSDAWRPADEPPYEPVSPPEAEPEPEKATTSKRTTKKTAKAAEKES